METGVLTEQEPYSRVVKSTDFGYRLTLIWFQNPSSAAQHGTLGKSATSFSSSME